MFCVFIKVVRIDLGILVIVVIIAPAIDLSAWNVRWQETAEPVDVINRPSFFTVSIDSMNGYNTVIK